MTRFARDLPEHYIGLQLERQSGRAACLSDRPKCSIHLLIEPKLRFSRPTFHHLLDHDIDWAVRYFYVASQIDKPKRARQLARAIASDLTLYHEAKILDGIANDSLFEVMSSEIEEGRELFRSRVTDDIYGQNIYMRAVVDVLVKSKGHIKSKIW